MSDENLDVTVARLDERVKGHDSFIEEMAGDLKSMAISIGELAKSNQRISLVEQDVINLKDEQKILWQKFDANEKVQKKVMGTVLYDCVKLLVAVWVGVELAKAGIHLP